MKKNIYALFLIIFLGFSVAHGANSDVGTLGGSVLFDTPSARALGMGGAYSAVADDANALFSNPAGLGRAKNFEFIASHRQMVESITKVQLGLVYPFDDGSTLKRVGLGVLGFSVGQVNFGAFQGKDAAGNAAGGFSARDNIVQVAYGTRILRSFYIGGDGKYYNSALGDVESNGFIGDVGFLFYPEKSKFALSVSAFNLGGGIDYENQSDPLPRSVVYGAAFYPVGDSLVLSLDAVDSKDDFLQLKTGAEWWLNRILALRAGYDSTRDDGNGLSLGLGVQVEHFETFFIPVERMRIDYAFLTTQELSNDNSSTGAGVHTVTLSLAFGESRRVTKQPR